MELIKDIVKDVIGDLSDAKRKNQDEILRIWQEVLGNKATRHTKIIALKEKKLIVYVDSSVWLFQLNLKRNALLERLRGAKINLEAINFRIGKVT